jgi:CheY-like chemotaxis protein
MMRHILVVEDDPGVQDVLRMLCEDEGFSGVRRVERGERA